jgi:hypothetical protein
MLKPGIKSQIQIASGDRVDFWYIGHRAESFSVGVNLDILLTAGAAQDLFILPLDPRGTYTIAVIISPLPERVKFFFGNFSHVPQHVECLRSHRILPPRLRRDHDSWKLHRVFFSNAHKVERNVLLEARLLESPGIRLSDGRFKFGRVERGVSGRITDSAEPPHHLSSMLELIRQHAERIGRAVPCEHLTMAVIEVPPLGRDDFQPHAVFFGKTDVEAGLNDLQIHEPDHQNGKKQRQGDD